MSESEHGRIPDGLYRQIVEAVPIFTVDVLFFDADRQRTLLFKRANEPAKGEYFCIGGRVLKNESPTEAAVRKAKEELGLKISADDLWFGGLSDDIFETSSFPGVPIHNVNAHWGCIWPGGREITLDDQHTEYAWFDVTEPSLHTLVKERISNLLNSA